MQARISKTGTCIFFLLAAAMLQGQETLEPSSPPAANMLNNLTLDPETRTRIANALSARNYPVAEEILRHEAERKPDRQPVLLVLANVFFLNGRHLECAVALKKAEALSPLDERHRLLLALSYVTIGRLNWARPEFETLARLNPANATYPYWLARIAYRKMDIRSATAHAQKAIELDPSFMKAYDQLGLCYDAEGKTENAIRAFERALYLNEKLAVRSAWPALNLGNLLMRLQRLPEAEARFRASIGINVRFPVARYRLGQVLEKQQRFDEAIEELERAVELDPTYPEPHYALARIYRRRGDARAGMELRKFEDLRKADRQRGITRPN